MNILVASDAFKGSLTSRQIGRIVQETLTDHHIKIVPVADGGEGMLQAMGQVLDTRTVELELCDPLGRPVLGQYLLSQDGRMAIIESAVANGLGHLEAHEKNPMITSTFGVGQLIDHAIQSGAVHLVVGIGGSSTNDCGLGMLEALGVTFYDRAGKGIEGLTGGHLARVASFDLKAFHKRIDGIRFDIACDVDNPLLGPRGATYTYGPQKGATVDMLTWLEEAMAHFAGIVEKQVQEQSPVSVHDQVPGGGAAGGLGYCFHHFFGAKLKSGIDLVLDALGFNKSLADCDLIITGEGKIDHQTAMGKVVKGVGERAKVIGKPLVAICGQVEGRRGQLKEELGFQGLFAVVPEVATLEASLKDPAGCLRKLITQQVGPWLTQFENDKARRVEGNDRK